MSRPNDPPQPAPPPDAPEPIFVETRDELETWCDRWRQRSAVGIDTEFFRERTFYPVLGLLQVGDGTNNVLIDPLVIEDLEPLKDLLLAPGVTKVLHSCSEDLEVLYHRFQCFPDPFFDTQIAAALTGLGSSVGYARLVETLFDVALPKGHTRSNWLRRPLAPEQMHYAALDVAYLLPAFDHLRRRLESLGREDWLRQEVEQLKDPSRFLPDPETVYRSLGSSRSMRPRELAVLRELAAWRERQARRRDLPRNFVLRQETLSDLARRQPRSLKAVAEARGMRDTDVKRHGKRLLQLISKAQALPQDRQPPRRRRPLDLTPYRRQVDALRAAVARKAAELDLPPELLATRKTAESLVRRAVEKRALDLPPDSWRRDLLEPLVRDALEAKT